MGDNVVRYFATGRGTPVEPSVLAVELASHFAASPHALTSSMVLEPLTGEEAKSKLDEMPDGNIRTTGDVNLVLMGAIAAAVFAPFNARIVLGSDPFEEIKRAAPLFGRSEKYLTIRLHDALLRANQTITLDQNTFTSIAAVLPRRPVLSLPPAPLSVSKDPAGPVLVIGNAGVRHLDRIKAALARAFPKLAFEQYDRETVFHRSWSVVIQLGLCTATEPGARLRDAWAGNVPVIQFVDQQMQRGAAKQQHWPLEQMVQPGATGMLSRSLGELLHAVGNLASDTMVRRALAKAAAARFSGRAVWNNVVEAVVA